MTVILETSRLVIREMDMSDLDFVAEKLGDAEVMRYWPRRLDREESLTWLKLQLERYERDGFGYWLAEEKEPSRPVGQIGLMKVEIDGVEEVGLGYMVHRPYWRMGFAYEGAAGVLDHAFNVLDCSRVVCPVQAGNEPSFGVAEKLGLEMEKVTTFAGSEHRIYVATR